MLQIRRSKLFNLIGQPHVLLGQQTTGTDPGHRLGMQKDFVQGDPLGGSRHHFVIACQEQKQLIHIHRPNKVAEQLHLFFPATLEQALKRY